MSFLIFAAIGVAIGLRISTPEERARALTFVRAILTEVKDAAALNQQKCEPFQQTLRARTRWVFITPAIVAVNVMAFAGMLMSDGAIGDAKSLLAWGGNQGPLTTNGEWWRLLTSVFVHAGVIHLLVTTAALLQVGSLVERLAGPTVVAIAYVASGVLASLAAVSVAPMATAVGSSGAVFGVYGLLLAIAIRSWRDPESLQIPRVMLKRLAPLGALFLVHSLATTALPAVPELVGAGVGLACGLVLLWDVSEPAPSIRRVAVTAGSALVIAAAVAVPLRGVADVRPEIERLTDLEARTAATYREAAERLQKRKTTAKALADTIDGEILPELAAVDERLRQFKGVPAEHQPLVKGAEDYIRLRSESWRLRAEALRGSNAATLRSTARPARAATENARRGVEASHQSNLFTFANADTRERESLQALARTQAAARQ